MLPKSVSSFLKLEKFQGQDLIIVWSKLLQKCDYVLILKVDCNLTIVQSLGRALETECRCCINTTHK